MKTTTLSTSMEMLVDAQKRMPTQREILLKTLREAGHKGVLNTDLVEICIGYRSRIAELYQMGYDIRVENIERGVCIYTLVSEPEVPVKTVAPAVNVLAEKIQKDYHGAITADKLQDLLKELNFNVVRRAGSHKIS